MNLGKRLNTRDPTHFVYNLQENDYGILRLFMVSRMEDGKVGSWSKVFYAGLQNR